MRLSAACLVWSWLVLAAVVASPGPARADWRSQFEAEAQAAFEASGSPGMALVIVKDDAVVLAKGYGRLTSDPASPAVDLDSVFLLGSTSKAFLATQFAVLADQQRLAWDDSVVRHAPWFAMSDPWVTAQFQVRDMLSHQSGLPMYALTMMELLDYPTASRVAGIRFIRPATSLRTTFAYQNVMYIAASKLIETITGQSWQDHLATSLLTPLGMTRSVASQDAVNRMANVAIGHIPLADGSLWPVPADWFWNETQDRAMGAAAVRTSAHDMGQWLRCNLALGRIATRQVVSQANMRALQAPKVLISPWQQGHQGSPHWGPVSYSLGWMRFDLSPQPFLFHDGGAMGSGSAVGFAPGANVGIAVMSNVLAGDGLASDLVWRFYDLYFETDGSVAPSAGSLLQSLRRSPAAPASGTVGDGSDAGRSGTPAREPGRYCGRYRNPAYGVFEVRRAGQGLEIIMGPGRFAAAMTATGGDAFTAELPGYPSGFSMGIPLHFSFPESGPVALTTGPILLDPAETFVRAGDVPLLLLLLDNP